MASLTEAGARQPERQREDINIATQNLKESSGANKCCFDQSTNLNEEDRQIGDFPLVHKTKNQLSHGAKLYPARW
jgi:hypothetical protein